MSRSLQLARRGLYTTDPNPRVGCILVKDYNVLAEAWHEYAGGPHAEINALQLAGDNAKDTDCFVTLEPCAHTGKTPPCTESLIKAGVKRVVAATSDPNPLVAGQGLKALEAAGIKTEVGLMQSQAQALNPGFEMRMRDGRPFVRCKLAMSIDGRTALASGESHWISGEESRMDVQRLRARSSAIMTGINTVLADDPSLNVREIDTNGRQPLRVILDSELRTPKTAKMLELPGETLIFTVSENTERQDELGDVSAQIVKLQSSDKKEFLCSVLQYLAEEREVNEVMLETGATLAGSMLDAGLIDELIFYVAPTILGHDAKALFQLPGIKAMSDHVQLAFTDVRMIGNDCRITAKIRKEAN